MLNLNKMFRRGHIIWGSVLKFNDPAVVEILGTVGFQFVLIDREHATLDELAVEHLIRAALLTGIAPVVRVSENRAPMISKALDMGASGVVVPHITTRADAERAVRAAKFYPLGERGVDSTVRAGNYSLFNPTEYYRTSNENTAIILQLEGLEAVENVEEIVAVPAIDAIFVGPYDLSQSMGIPGQVQDAELRRKMKMVIAVCKQVDITIGTFVGSLDDFEFWVDAGVQFFWYSTDSVMFASEAKRVGEMLTTSSQDKSSTA